MADPSVSAGVITGFLDFAAARGADRAALTVNLRVDPDHLADRDNRVPFADYVAMVRAAKRLTGNDALALHYGEAVDLSDLSVVGMITRSAPTMADALAQLNRYGSLVVELDLGSTDRFEITRENGHVWVVDHGQNTDDFPELGEVTFARTVCGPRRFTDQLKVGEVHFTHPAPAHAPEYDGVFEAPVIFASDRNAMRLDGDWLTHPVALQPSYVFGILIDHADALMERLEATTTLSGRIESLLLPRLHTGAARIDSIAQEMGVSRQTLYRKLKAEGLTFEKLLDRLRHKMALHYLGAGKVSINEAAYLLGFSDRAAFSRAHKRWTGRSPRAT